MSGLLEEFFIDTFDHERLLVLYPCVVADHQGAQGLAVDQDDPGRHPVCGVREQAEAMIAQACSEDVKYRYYALRLHCYAPCVSGTDSHPSMKERGHGIPGSFPHAPGLGKHARDSRYGYWGRSVPACLVPARHG